MYKRKEAALDLNSFNERVTNYIKSAKEYIEHLNGKTVFFGAAAKGSVFLNALGLSVENMPEAYIIDDTYEKQGYYLPGTGFEICSRDRLFNDNVNNIILLSHNFKDHIIDSLRKGTNGEDIFNGDIITMLPNIEVDTTSNSSSFK